MRAGSDKAKISFQGNLSGGDVGVWVSNHHMFVMVPSRKVHLQHPGEA